MSLTRAALWALRSSGTMFAEEVINPNRSNSLSNSWSDSWSLMDILVFTAAKRVCLVNRLRRSRNELWTAPHGRLGTVLRRHREESRDLRFALSGLQIDPPLELLKEHPDGFVSQS